MVQVYVAGEICLLLNPIEGQIVINLLNLIRVTTLILISTTLILISTTLILNLIKTSILNLTTITATTTATMFKLITKTIIVIMLITGDMLILIIITLRVEAVDITPLVEVVGQVVVEEVGQAAVVAEGAAAVEEAVIDLSFLIKAQYFLTISCL
jgi:hypothetical protein